MRKLWNSLKLLFARCFGISIPYVSEQKTFGMEGEEQLSKKILELIPSCRIKNNIIIHTSEGNAEIDCLVLVGSRLFAIEVKRWKGDLIETEQCMIQKKVDQWTEEIYIKQHRSPFKQLGRAIYLLHNQVKSSAWINPVVFFEDADSVCIESEGVWFEDASDLLTYMSFGGKSSPGYSASDLFDRCIASDYLFNIMTERLDFSRQRLIRLERFHVSRCEHTTEPVPSILILYDGTTLAKVMDQLSLLQRLNAVDNVIKHHERES